MSRKQRKNQIPTTNTNIPMPNVKQPKRMQGMDSFVNTLARLGGVSDNLISGSQYPITRLTRNYQLMNSLYRNSWITAKVINTIPDDMCKNWFSLTAEMKPDIQDRYMELEERTKTREKILNGLYWGRLYGGAAALILIEGQDHMLDMPLIPESILPNAYKGLMIVDRWSGVYPSLELITDICNPDFGLPEFYEIRDENGTIWQRVHHTRIIRFIGNILPFWEDQMEMHWGMSVMERVFDELTKRDNTSWNIASLVFQANLLVNKVDGLDQMMVMADAQAQQDFYNVKEAQNQMRNNSAMMLIGEKDEMTSMQYSFGGLSDIYNDFMLDISGASEIPVVKLFGRSPAGMNSTGESDMQLYYDMIGQKQTSVLKPILDKLIPIMFMSEFGYIPTDLGYKFNPVKTPDDTEIADLVDKKSSSVEKMYTAGIINQKHALTELHEMSYTTNMFSSITDEDIANAKTDFNDEIETDMFGGGLNALERMGNEQASGTEVPTEPEQGTKDDNSSNQVGGNKRTGIVKSAINSILQRIQGNSK